MTSVVSASAETEKISGIHSIIFACSGSGGVGLSLVCTNIETAISSGRM